MASPLAPKKAPPIDLPKGSETCKLAIVDTTCDIVVPPHLLVEPNIQGHNWLNLPTHAFHIVHEKTGRQLIFDLGCQKDWQNAVPHIADLAGNHVPGLRVKDNMVDVLEAGGVKRTDLEALILSHWHFDHCGDLTTLPEAVDLIVGPGFKDEFLPGYPAKQSSPFWEACFKGRNVIELPSNDKLKIGRFEAHDYFGDGSLYILNVPGHAVGHISALVRTTSDTVVFLGGDTCHFTGSVRPSEYIPLPDKIPSETVLGKHIPVGCPGSMFAVCHPDQGLHQTTPFYKVSTHENSFYVDPPTATRSIRYLAEFDADPNCLVLIAHDPSPRGIIPFFPNNTLNDWKAKGYKEKMHWRFLNELPYEGKTHTETLTDGLYNDKGLRVKDLAQQPV